MPPSPSNCICPNAKRKKIKAQGGAGQFDVDLEVNETVSFKGQKAVCRIWSIVGPIQRQKRPSSQTPEEAMKDLLFGKSNFRQRYDPGHVIAATLGGPHSTENLVPFNMAFNTSGGWVKFEDRVRKCLEDPKVKGGTMSVFLEYGNTGEAMYVPTTFTVVVGFEGPNGKLGGPGLEFRNKSGDKREFKGKPCFGDWS